MKWIDPAVRKPPQGKKVLWFKNGDMQVVQRWGDYWFPIPFADSEFVHTEEPQLWADIIPPEGYSGKITVAVPDEDVEGRQFYKMMDIDMLERIDKEAYESLFEMIRQSFARGVTNDV